MRPIHVILATLVLLPCGGRSLIAAPPSAGDHILLDNGHVLVGKLIDEGEQVLLRLGPGSQMRLPRTRIRGVGPDRHALYVLQRRQLHASNRQGHIKLARWCLRNDLHRQTSELLTELARRAPGDPQIGHLQQQLRQALAPPVAAVPRPLPPVATEENDESQQAADAVTRAQLIDFTSRVQPVLINHCSAAGCHGTVAESDFRLLRPFTGQRLTQRMTNRNLQEALDFVNANDPMRSLLLLAATEPHADRDAPILGGPRDEPSLMALQAWVSSFKSAKAAPPEFATDETHRPSPLPKLSPTADTDIGPHRPSPDGLEVQPTAHQAITNTRPMPALGDPYDPGAFNRKYFPERFEERHPLDVPDEPVTPLPAPSRLNSPAASASRNATLLDKTPGNSRIPAGESH